MLLEKALFGLAIFILKAEARLHGDNNHHAKDEEINVRVTTRSDINHDTTLGIIGGKEIVPHSRPYLVRFGGCGGSLITPEVVLTAAHCVAKVNNYNLVEWNPKGKDHVDINRHDIYENETDDDDFVSASRLYLNDTSNSTDSDIIMHPEYSGGPFFLNDAALLFLPRPVYGITPVELGIDPDLLSPGDPIDIVGWGRTTVDNAPIEWPIYPREVMVNLLSDEECDIEIMNNGGKYWKEKNSTDYLCLKADGKRQCKGDSGGPQFIGSPDGGPANDPPVQVGIVSHGNGRTCDPDYVTFGTPISKVGDWIMDAVCERTGELCDGGEEEVKMNGEEVLVEMG